MWAIRDDSLTVMSDAKNPRALAQFAQLRVLDRARGVLLGLAVGDALGGPLEFLSAEDIKTRYDEPVRDYIGGGWLDLQPGHGTDDTALALALARSMVTRAGYVPERALAAYLDWFRSGPPDVGATTRAALEGIESDLSPAEATEAFHRKIGRSAGNGSLMRIAPIGIRYLIDHEGREKAALLDSKLTHYDDHAADACGWLCGVVAVLIRGADPAELAAPSDLDRAWTMSPEAAAEAAIGPMAGHVDTALGVAAAALRNADSFEDGLIWAVNLGGDTDTNGAVAGALLGARFGASQIPPRWLAGLAVRDEADALAAHLLALAQPDLGRSAQSQDPEMRGLRQTRAFFTASARLEAALEPFAGRLEHAPESRLAAEAAIAETGVFREGPMFVSNIPERDVLYVYERGYSDDGIEEDRLVEICHHVSLILDLDREKCIGFIFGDLSEFDFEAPENAVVWTGPRFDVPALGIEQGTVGLIAATARLVLGDLRTPDRVLFDAAMGAEGNPEEALALWEACLAEGNELARYAIGYTLLELDRAREAHEQLKHYSALVRGNAWAWCYLGQACEKLEDWEGAEYAYRQALEATAAGSFKTDAPELLADLLPRVAQLRNASAQ